MTEGGAPFVALVEQLTRSGAAHVIHAHAPTRTVEDARALTFDLTRLVKTIAFRTAAGDLLLVALRGTRRVDYARLAAVAGVNRRALAPLSPDEVVAQLGVEPGAVSPVPLRPDLVLLVDEDVLTITPTLYCGIGQADRTLEIAPADLIRVTGGRVAAVSRALA
jgi:Cys-tRNA(Pro)/Cys-tRNA(Cys) deacylase